MDKQEFLNKIAEEAFLDELEKIADIDKSRLNIIQENATKDKLPLKKQVENFARTNGNTLKNVGYGALAGAAALGIGTAIYHERKRRREMDMDKEAGFSTLLDKAKGYGTSAVNAVGNAGKEVGRAFSLADYREGREKVAPFKEEYNNAMSEIVNNKEMSTVEKLKSAIDPVNEYAEKSRDGRTQMLKGLGKSSLAYGATAAAGLGTALYLRRKKAREQQLSQSEI